jgi:CheY-like chemotaxis protein
MDIVMPIMNGITATRSIRNELKLSTLPIIMLTADVSEDTRAEAMAAGASEYILKPAYTKSIIKLLHSRNLYAQVPENSS